MNNSFNGGAGFGSPQGKFVQRLCFLEDENSRLKQQINNLLEWKTSIEEYLMDNLGYAPGGVSSANVNAAVTGPGSNNIGSSTEEVGSNDSEESNSTYPMNGADENPRNTRRHLDLNDLSYLPTVNNVSVGTIAGTSGTAVSFASLKREIPSPETSIIYNNNRTEEVHLNGIHDSLLDNENEVNGDVPADVANNGAEDDEDDDDSNDNDHAVIQNRDEGSIIIPGRTLQRNERNSNSTSSRASASNSAVYKIGKSPTSSTHGVARVVGAQRMVSKKKKNRAHETHTPQQRQEPLPASFVQEVNEHTPCDICRLPNAGDNDEMVLCDGCNVCVHQRCYGVAVIPEGEWKCRTCVQGILPNAQSCRFCTTTGGAMIPVQSPAKKHWAHVSCTWWIPGPSINNPHKVDFVVGLPLIQKSRWNLLCCYCKRGKGITCCIQCGYKRCTKSFHVTCAFKTGIRMHMIEDDDADSGIIFISYCEQHRNAQLPTVLNVSQRKKRRLDNAPASGQKTNSTPTK